MKTVLKFCFCCFYKCVLIRGPSVHLVGRTGHTSRPAGRSHGARAPLTPSEGTWAVLTAGGQTEAPGCYAAWREGNLEKQQRQAVGV